jgi:hypothetical protein
MIIFALAVADNSPVLTNAEIEAQIAEFERELAEPQQYQQP